MENEENENEEEEEKEEEERLKVVHIVRSIKLGTLSRNVVVGVKGPGYTKYGGWGVTDRGRLVLLSSKHGTFFTLVFDAVVVVCACGVAFVCTDFVIVMYGALQGRIEEKLLVLYCLVSYLL